MLSCFQSRPTVKAYDIQPTLTHTRTPYSTRRTNVTWRKDLRWARTSTESGSEMLHYRNSTEMAVRTGNSWDMRYTCIKYQELCIAGLQTAAGGASIVHSFIATSRLLFYVRHPPIISPSHSPSYHGGGPHSCYCISCNAVPIILSRLIAWVQQGIYVEYVSVKLNYCIYASLTVCCYNTDVSNVRTLTALGEKQLIDAQKFQEFFPLLKLEASLLFSQRSAFCAFVEPHGEMFI